MHCPVCRSKSSSRRFEARNQQDGIPGWWWVRECDNCHSLFLENPPSPQELERLYPEDSYYAYRVQPPRRLKKFLHALFRYSNATRDPEFTAPGYVLDFGCGAGEWLLMMRSRGWRCAGVEISAGARKEAANLGLDVRASSAGFASETFDFVRTNHSLEHVTDPRAILTELHRVLKPGGMLFIGIPTATSENARAFGPDWWYLTPPLHPFVPSTDGLLNLVRECGFQVQRTITNSDYASTAGSLQMRLNRGTNRRANQGLLFSFKPLLLIGHWFARIQDYRGVGDKLEVTAVKVSA